MTETLKTTPLEIIKDNGRNALLWLLSGNIGQGWQKTGAPSGNVLSQNYFNQDSSLLQTIRQKLKP